jgi:sulfatase maturation enzyme AslB (radical SAM superfamily)
MSIALASNAKNTTLADSIDPTRVASAQTQPDSKRELVSSANTNTGGAERQLGPTVNQITSICFRVTRACNLRCSYCQAPPNAKQLNLSELFDALEYLARHGTRRVKFTGGEPFLHHGILPLVEKCRTLDMEPTIVTNGTVLPSGSLESLRNNRARVKISLHGPRDVHNFLQGQEVYDTVVATIKTLIEAGIETSIHTLLYRGSNLDLEAWVTFLTSLGVHKVSFMTFVPRGRGRAYKDEWSFSGEELEELSRHIDQLSTKHRGKIIVRCLDFARKPYIVFETDGSINWQVAEEDLDEKLIQVAVRSGEKPPLRAGHLVKLSEIAVGSALSLEVGYGADSEQG